MGYDNRLLNINGESDAQLLAALKVAFMDQYGEKTCKAWEVRPGKGLVLYQYCSDAIKANQFLVPVSAEEVFPIVKKWLATKEAREIGYERWEGDLDHDGSNIDGWRVYLEDWGHIDNQWGALCCIKHCYLWLGK